MTYFKTEKVLIDKRTCNHPRVKRFWQVGGLAETPTSSSAYLTSCFMMDNGEVIGLDHKSAENWEQEANEFLVQLNNIIK